MGCDIHTIVEIRKDGKWQYVPDLPKDFDERNYKTFACLAGVRDDFGNKVFEPKGLPTNLSGTHFRFKSDRQSYEDSYNTKTTTVFVDANGNKSEKWIKATEIDNMTYDDILKNIKEANPEYLKRYRDPYWSEKGGERKYYVQDATSQNGHFETVKYTDIYKTFQDYANENLQDEYVADADDYGYWKVDFEDTSDLHSASYLTLTELKTADYTRYTALKYKMEKEFYDAFKAAGGEFPKKFEVIEEPLATDFFTVIRESVCPVVTVIWQPDEINEEEYSVFRGRKELEEIAVKYGLSSTDDIRIVFAFDN